MGKLQKILAIAIFGCAIVSAETVNSSTISYPNLSGETSNSSDSLQHQKQTKLKFAELVYRGNSLHDEGFYKEAIDAYRQADSLLPGKSTLQYEIAYSFLMLGARDSAKIYGLKAIEESKTYDAYNIVGEIYDYEGKLDSSMLYYDRGIEKYPRTPELYYNKAVALLNHGRSNEAYTTAKQSLKYTYTHEGSYYLVSDLAFKRTEWIDFFANATLSNIVGTTEARINASTKRWTNLLQFFIGEYIRTGSIQFNPSPHHVWMQQICIDIKGTAKNDSLMKILSENVYELTVYASINALRRAAESNYDFELKPMFREIVKNGFEEAYCRYAFSSMDEIASSVWFNLNQKKIEAFVKWFMENHINPYN